MLFVVIGHNVGIWLNAPDLARAIYLFHMPLFFFTTGLTTDLLGAAGLNVRRVIVVAIQYLVLSIGMIPVGVLFNGNGSLTAQLAGILYGTGHTIDVTPLWFLPCLACALTYILCIGNAMKLVGVKSIEPLTIVLIATALSFVGAWALNFLHGEYQYILDWGSVHESGTFWGADVAILGSAFVLFGIGWRVYGARLGGPLLNFGFVAGAVIALAFAVRYGVRTDLHFRRFSPSIFALLCSLIGIVGSIGLINLLARIEYVGRALSVVGRSSLIVLVLHNGLQNRGAKVSLLPVLGDGFLYWAVAASLAVVLPVAIDRLIIRKVALLNSIVYPRIHWLARSHRSGVDCAPR